MRVQSAIFPQDPRYFRLVLPCASLACPAWIRVSNVWGAWPCSCLCLAWKGQQGRVPALCAVLVDFRV